MFTRGEEIPLLSQCSLTEEDLEQGHLKMNVVGRYLYRRIYFFWFGKRSWSDNPIF